MKLSVVVMFISFLLYQRGAAELKPKLITRNESLKMIYWHFHLTETLDSARQICKEYGMNLFSIKRQKNNLIQSIYEKFVNFLDGSKGHIMLVAFVCEKHWIYGNGYYHQIEDGATCAATLHTIKTTNYMQCAFYCNINKKCQVYCIYSHLCVLYTTCVGTCSKVRCLKHHCYAKV